MTCGGLEVEKFERETSHNLHVDEYTVRRRPLSKSVGWQLPRVPEARSPGSQKRRQNINKI